MLNETFCSQCGGRFGPGPDHYSHCDQHQGMPNLDGVSPMVDRAMAHFYAALAKMRATKLPN